MDLDRRQASPARYRVSTLLGSRGQINGSSGSGSNNDGCKEAIYATCVRKSKRKKNKKPPSSSAASAAINSVSCLPDGVRLKEGGKEEALASTSSKKPAEAANGKYEQINYE